MLRKAPLVLALTSIVCGDPHAEASSGGPGTAVVLGTDQVASGLENPVYLTAPVGDARLFIVEQPGRIRVVEKGQLLSAPFLDIRAKVGFGGERGLLSVAFHPQYRANGFLFVNYTDRSGDTRIERYTVSADRNLADPASAKLILAIDQPYSNHNGGLNMFGLDGMLYIGMGDGGSQGDPNGNGQNPRVLLGKLLRINVDRGDPYALPAANPYARNGGGKGEIWAVGLRNPWRFSFDKPTGMLYIADVGQDAYEEIDIVSASLAGVNYGWNRMEGNSCLGSPLCSQAGLQKPELTYSHKESACSVIGGFVYRGAKIPEIQGQYFYSDYCNSWLRSLKYVDGGITEQHEWPIGKLGSIASFGEDSTGELYICATSGKVFRIVRK